MVLQPIDMDSQLVTDADLTRPISNSVTKSKQFESKSD